MTGMMGMTGMKGARGGEGREGLWRRASPLYRSVGLVFFFAFASLYAQYPGLLGSNGLLPVSAFLARVQAQGSGWGWGWGDGSFPSLLALAPAWQVPEDCLAEALMLLGAGCAALLAGGVVHPLLLFVCWVTYLSLYLVGQTFLSFQWDILLLEVSSTSVLQVRGDRHQLMLFVYVCVITIG
jgi:hypothetical protein